MGQVTKPGLHYTKCIPREQHNGLAAGPPDGEAVPTCWKQREIPLNRSPSGGFLALMKLVSLQCGERRTSPDWFAYTAMIVYAIFRSHVQGNAAGTSRVGEKFQLGPVPGAWACERESSGVPRKSALFGNMGRHSYLLR